MSTEEETASGTPAQVPQEIVIGSVVKLKSGGPEMTVDETGENENEGKYANCVWFGFAPADIKDPYLAGNMIPMVDVHSHGFNINSLIFVR